MKAAAGGRTLSDLFSWVRHELSVRARELQVVMLFLAHARICDVPSRLHSNTNLYRYLDLCSQGFGNPSRWVRVLHTAEHAVVLSTHSRTLHLNSETFTAAAISNALNFPKIEIRFLRNFSEPNFKKKHSQSDLDVFEKVDNYTWAAFPHAYCKLNLIQ